MVSHIIQETLNAIWKALKDKYVSPPKSATDWKNISRDFESVWHLPHCIGAIDGKHIAMQCPKNSGSLYFNYKGWFSIVLMAVCDASYNFTLVDIGQYGSPNDSSVLNNSEMGKAFEDGSMSLPQPEHLPGCGLPQLPFYLVGDKIFALKPWLLQPYPGKNIKEEESIFNYRLSRARRVIENCFGILVARWRIFCRAIQAKVETVQAIVQAAICLHNYLRQTLLLTVRLASLTALMIQEIFCQESGTESLQLMKIPVLFVTYLLRKEPDIAIMLWMSARL